VPKPAKIHTTRIPGAHVKKVEEYEKAERSPPGTEAQSSIKVFTTPELHKKRERLIEHPVDINDATKDDVDKTKFLPQAERHNVLLCEDGVVSADVDASGFFDHFGLGEEVRDFYAFLYRGELWRFKVLPMGLRHSVAIAHTATRMLLNYDMKGVHAEPYIDNIRFVGKPEEVVEAMSTFLLRCKAVCVTLNEVDVTTLAGQGAWYHEGQRIRRAGRYLQTNSTIRQARSTDGQRRSHRRQHSGLRFEQRLQSVLHRQHHLQQDRTGVPTLGTPHAAHPGREQPGGRPLQRMR
jgi:hypothetical protein